MIGNGIAGVTAADFVRRGHPDCEIHLVGREPHGLYNRMGISRLVYGRSAMQGLGLLPDGWYQDHDVTAWLMREDLQAFRGSQRHLLLIGFHRRMASSLAALSVSLQRVAQRLRDRLVRRGYTVSDDGTRLRIGNEEVVTNDGVHGAKEASGEIALRAGRHAITLLYFQGGGPASLDVLWEGPDLPKQKVPGAALTHIPAP